MSLTDTGAIAIASLLISDGGITLFNEANAAIGVGDDNTGFLVSQTELEAEANSGGLSFRRGMDGGYPDRDPDVDGSDDKIRFKASFANDEANLAWEEWGIFNDDTEGGGTMLLRVVESLGTKTNADSWLFEVDITVKSA